MLTIENTVRLGLVLIVASAALDVLLALAGGGHGEHHGLPERTAHVIALVGMVLVMAGVVTFGARRHSHRRQRAAARGGSSDAPR
jgi:uncharacterized membrane protein YidH (DUF202 family)